MCGCKCNVHLSSVCHVQRLCEIVVITGLAAFSLLQVARLGSHVICALPSLADLQLCTQHDLGSVTKYAEKAADREGKLSVQLFCVIRTTKCVIVKVLRLDW